MQIVHTMSMTLCVSCMGMRTTNFDVCLFLHSVIMVTNPQVRNTCTVKELLKSWLYKWSKSSSRVAHQTVRATLLIRWGKNSTSCLTSN